MKLDIIKVREAILSMEEMQPGHEKEDLKKLLCAISGNKAYHSQVNLEDILYLIENAESILEKELDYIYPKINLKNVPGSARMTRRAI